MECESGNFVTIVTCCCSPQSHSRLSPSPQSQSHRSGWKYYSRATSKRPHCSQPHHLPTSVKHRNSPRISNTRNVVLFPIATPSRVKLYWHHYLTNNNLFALALHYTKPTTLIQFYQRSIVVHLQINQSIKSGLITFLIASGSFSTGIATSSNAVFANTNAAMLLITVARVLLGSMILDIDNNISSAARLSNQFCRRHRIIDWIVDCRSLA
mmetsp:Transcript_31004/g.65477  ORF Transcript_31004/g.65477 Transcript_31004/m.65477 type:complete len:211 (+) Transcript_31004:857-1489(+)